MQSMRSKSPYVISRPQDVTQRCLWSSSNVRPIDNGPLSSFQGRSRNTSSFHASFLQVIDCVVSLALCSQVIFQDTWDLPRRKPLVMVLLPVCLLCHFSSLQCIRRFRRWMLIESVCIGLPFHCPFFVASPLSLWGWWHPVLIKLP